MARRRDDDGIDGFTAVVALALVAGPLGWAATAKEFVLERLPLFVALAAALVVLVVLVLRRWARSSREKRRRQAVLDAEISTADLLSGQDFERLVARLLERDGYRDVRVSGGSGDLGADVLATAPDGRRVVVQCKRYAQHRSVSSPDVQRFLGTCFHEHGADDAWFVTTTRFSTPARRLGSSRGVRLVDRDELAAWMAEGATPVSPAA